MHDQAKDPTVKTTIMPTRTLREAAEKLARHENRSLNFILCRAAKIGVYARLAELGVEAAP